MNRARLAFHSLVFGAVLLLSGCSAAATSEPDSPEIDVSESSSVPAPPEAFMESLDEIAGTEWTGLDDTYRDRVTFLFAPDGTLSYRTGEGTFTYEGDTWTVEGEVLTFLATYGGDFGVATHVGSYDPETGELRVEYTTVNNRNSSYTLRQVD